MLTRRRTRTTTVCLLLGTLLCILGCDAISSIKTALTPGPNGIPIMSMDITMDLDQREEFFTQLHNFADKRSLQLETTYYDADKKAFLVHLKGDGFHITGGANLYSPKEIGFGVYNEASPSISQETLDEIFNDLKSFLREIPNVIIREKLKRLKITMDENQRQELFTKLFTQLRVFANQHSLEFVTASYDAELNTFLVQMQGDGFQITSEAVRNPPNEINVDFYIHYEDNGFPTSTSQKTVDELFDDLKDFFGVIPNVSITEEK
jgi:hypothetical protein